MSGWAFAGVVVAAVAGLFLVLVIIDAFLGRGKSDGTGIPTLYCPVCVHGYEGRETCPAFGCGDPKLVTLADAVAANEALVRLLSPDPDRETA